MTLYNVQEVKDTLKVSQDTIYRMIHDGQLPAVKIRSIYRIRERDLEKFLEGEEGRE